MTWGEVKVISLQKMFATDEPIAVSDLPDLKESDDCKWYLSAMPAVANEAMQRIKLYIKNTYEYNETNKKYEIITIAKIDDATADDWEIPFAEEACVLIPLYIASQLYKDDDIAQATQYRNEFEAGLQELIFNIDNPTEIKTVLY